MSFLQRSLNRDIDLSPKEVANSLLLYYQNNSCAFSSENAACTEMICYTLVEYRRKCILGYHIMQKFDKEKL